MQCSKNYKGLQEKKKEAPSGHRLVRTPNDRKRLTGDIQKFNMDTRKYRGVIAPTTATSLRQAALQRPEKPFLAFGGMREARP